MLVNLLKNEDLKNLPQPADLKPCSCALGACPAWESMTEDRWPVADMQPLGTLRDPDVYEPTFEKHHPDRTRYDSPDASVSAQHFPFNRCDVYRCMPCQRVLMRYTEFGGKCDSYFTVIHLNSIKPSARW